ncbi:uncharacterized protein LOC113312462 [Papaver somniferum]|uniref:uncharacterized protein LOC113312462 n=1 Tax=Papaver somniferum TaxID=3469 RepID=UPI000E703991|nr:uncharacterized protein LOC113312462 [Papaver somniferum]
MEEFVSRLLPSYISGWVSQSGGGGGGSLSSGGIGGWLMKFLRALQLWDMWLSGGHRSIHRKTLLEALAEELPAYTIYFSPKFISIETQMKRCKSSKIMLHLDYGTSIHTKVLIGCVGVHSVQVELHYAGYLYILKSMVWNTYRHN